MGWCRVGINGWVVNFASVSSYDVHVVFCVREDVRSGQ